VSAIEALPIQRALAMVREHGPRHKATRLGLHSPRLVEHHPRQVVFLLTEGPSTVAAMQDALSEAAKLTPRLGIDLTLRCFLWEKPLTAQLLNEILK